MTGGGLFREIQLVSLIRMYSLTAVEIINWFSSVHVHERSLRFACCSQFRRSLDCVRVMKEVCPRAKHEEMNEALRPYVAVFNMCTKQHFIEGHH